MVKYIITQYSTTELHGKMQESGCQLLLTSDQMEFVVYSFLPPVEDSLRTLCQTFKRYAGEVLQRPFFYDIFTREEIEQSGQFDEEFIEALERAEAK
jgi:hypothetical protein